MVSPKRPHTPHGEKELSPGDVESISEDEIAAGNMGTEKSLDIPTLKLEVKQVPIEPLKKIIPIDPVESLEEAAPMDLEQFEPILSDEDICDETENFQDIDYDFSAYSNNDDLIQLFNPLSTELQKYRSATYIDFNKLMTETSESVFKLINKYFEKYNEQTISLIEVLKPHNNKYINSDFKSFSPEMKQEFVDVCEQLPALLNGNKQFFTFVQLHTLVTEGKINFEKLQVYEELKNIHTTLLEFLNTSLTFEYATSQNQPGYIIRHIKCGVRLAESCCGNHELVNILVEHNIHSKLLSLFDKEHMALSIKLLILKSLDACLCTDKSIDNFVNHNGYQTLINILKNISSVRIKFAVNSVLSKLNIYELLKVLKNTVFSWCDKDVLPEDQTFYVVQTLEQILKHLQKGAFVLSQPKRFLPVGAQFEISRVEEKSVLFNFFAMHNLPECLLLILTHPKSHQNTAMITIIYNIINEILKSSEGIQFLSENIKCTNGITKCFNHPEDLEAQYMLSESVYIKSQSLGLKIAYKMQSLYYVESLFELGPKNNYDCDVNEVLDQLHNLYCLTYINIGKIAVSDVLHCSDNMQCLLQFLTIIVLDMDKKDSRLRKSPGVGYIVDLISLVISYSTYIPFLEKYGKRILEISQQHDKFETNIAIKLIEILAYLKPLAYPNIFSYDDIKPLCEIVKQSLENVTNYPSELITTLRILKYLGISNYDNQCPVLSENSNDAHIELKYKYVILQIFGMDGVSNYLQILQKICEFYKQPVLHTTTFTSTQGVLIINTVLPCVQLLKQMIMNVINCRNVKFKDLTAVTILLQTFNLAHSFPATSIVYAKAKKVCKEIVDILLVYSQPISEEVSENDSLTKTLWTLMSGEVIKYITLAPFTFIPGLLIFSELLPLPLPFQTGSALTEEEIKRAINLRKLWSAHLHTYSTSIQELINRLCTSLHQPLLHLLRRVCIQLSDLAANTAIMIARGVLDSVHSALVPKSDKPQPIICNGHTARLLHFLACLTTHGAIKCAVLQLFWNHANSLKTDEKYPALVATFCQILKTNNDAQSHLQAQECIANIIQNICDTEITLIQTPDGLKSETITSDTYLANSLPPKEMLLTFLTTLTDLLTSDNTFATLLPITRTFILLSEHDFGFFHLYSCFEKKQNCFLYVLKKFMSNFSKDNTELLQTMSTVFDFLRLCSDDMELEGTLMFTPRSAKFSPKELKLLIGWKNEEYLEDNSKHLFFVLEALIKVTNYRNGYVEFFFLTIFISYSLVLRSAIIMVCDFCSY